MERNAEIDAVIQKSKESIRRFLCAGWWMDS
jgi:hypothetical protein